MMLRCLLDDYLDANVAIKSAESVRLLRISVDHYCRFLRREAEVADFSDRNFAAYVRYRRALGIADTTIERELAKLHTLTRYSIATGRLAPQPLRTFRANIGAPVGFTPAELRRLFLAARRYDRRVAGRIPGHIWATAICYTFWCSLERSGAVWHVERNDIDVSGFCGWIRFRVRKAGGRVLHRRLNWRGTRAVRRLLGAHDHPLVFSLGRHKAMLYDHWGRLLRAAGIPDDRYHGPHCMRRTGGSEFHARGGSAQEVLDHADERTTRRHYLVPGLIRAAQPTDRLPDPLGLWGRMLAALGW